MDSALQALQKLNREKATLSAKKSVDVSWPHLILMFVNIRIKCGHGENSNWSQEELETRLREILKGIKTLYDQLD